MLQKYFIYFLAVCFIFFSCQEESSFVEDNIEQQENINANMISLLSNMASNDGSIDNIIDNASCVEIVLPINVLVNGIQLTITTHNDLQAIEAILEHNLTDEDIVDIVFPITIILDDFTEITVESFEELTTHTNGCDNDNVVDEDIECLDIVFPITFNVFDIDSVFLETVQINDDQSLYQFILNISNDVVVSLNFPVQVALWDGSIISIASQSELQVALEVAQDACDEDDDNDYDDDDNIDQSIEELTILLTDCPWNIETLLVDTINFTSQFTNYHLDFNENATLSIFINGENEIGSWALEPFGESFRLQIDISGIPSLSSNWVLHTIQEETGLVLDFRDVLDVLRLQENCDIEDNDAGIPYTVEDVTNALQTCEWVLNIDENGDYFFYDFTFNSNQTISVMDLLNNQSLSGNWELEQNDDGEIVVVIENLDQVLGNLNNSWLIEEFMSDFIMLENAQGNFLTMSQTCPNDLDLTEVLLEGSNWRISYFAANEENLTADFANYVFDFDIGDQVFAIENNVNVVLGYWNSLNNSAGMSLNFAGGDPLNNLNSNYWSVLDLQTSRVELVYINSGIVYVVVFQSN